MWFKKVRAFFLAHGNKCVGASASMEMEEHPEFLNLMSNSFVPFPLRSLTSSREILPSARKYADGAVGTCHSSFKM